MLIFTAYLGKFFSDMTVNVKLMFKIAVNVTDKLSYI